MEPRLEWRLHQPGMYGIKATSALTVCDPQKALQFLSHPTFSAVLCRELAASRRCPSASYPPQHLPIVASYPSRRSPPCFATERKQRCARHLDTFRSAAFSRGYRLSPDWELFGHISDFLCLLDDAHGDYLCGFGVFVTWGWWMVIRRLPKLTPLTIRQSTKISLRPRRMHRYVMDSQTFRKTRHIFATKRAFFDKMFGRAMKDTEPDRSAMDGERSLLIAPCAATGPRSLEILAKKRWEGVAVQSSRAAQGSMYGECFSSRSKLHSPFALGGI